MGFIPWKGWTATKRHEVTRKTRHTTAVDPGI